VLVRLEHARARGARVLATLAGYATNCDAHSMVQIDESGERIVSLIGAALRAAGLGTADVEHVNAHGTSTPLGDRTEARALRETFGARCDEIPVTGIKSMTGHGIAASGPIETAAAAVGLHEGVLPPTINHDTPDPECDVDVVANRPRERAVRCCVKLSYGFGGHNACLVLVRA
jgi:3-oxoacyl-[acyl-carrier-protein] synthase II